MPLADSEFKACCINIMCAFQTFDGDCLFCIVNMGNNVLRARA